MFKSLVITGFTDAEGTFSFKLNQGFYSSKFGFIISPQFKIGLHIRELNLLKSIKDYFNVGYIHISGNSVSYSVTSVKELNVIIKHFDRYPLMSSKLYSFYIFTIILDMYKLKNNYPLLVLRK